VIPVYDGSVCIILLQINEPSQEGLGMCTYSLSHAKVARNFAFLFCNHGLQFSQRGNTNIILMMILGWVPAYLWIQKAVVFLR